jgi:hypothetical protein
MEAIPPNVIEFVLKRGAAHVVEGVEVYVEKIWAPVRFADLRPAVWLDCVLDTGTALTVIPFSRWKRFRSSIRWLDPPALALLPRWLKEFTSAAGGVVTCKPGLIDIRLSDYKYRNGFDLTIVALFMDSNANLDHPLLGIGGGVLGDAVLHLDYDRKEIRLEKRPAKS